MDRYSFLPNIIAVVVSVGLFLLGYRQTTGARKERIRAADSDVEKTLLKRIVLESYRPEVADITRLIDGKARDYRIRARDMFSPNQVLSTLFSRIMESDLISPKQRQEILERLNPALITAEQAPINEADIIDIERSKKKRLYRNLITSTLAVIAAVTGTYVAHSIETLHLGALTKDSLTAVTWELSILSLFVIGLIIIIIKLRESQEEPSANEALDAALTFEREVAKALPRFGVSQQFNVRNQRYDFYAEVNGKRVIIEVKPWGRNVPIVLLGRLVNQLESAIESKDADEAIIVTKEKLDLPQEDIEKKGIRIMTLKELRNYLAHGRSSV